jgi:hypothetical protein
VHVEQRLFVPINTPKVPILLLFQLKWHLSLTQMTLHLHLFIPGSLQAVASRVGNLFDSAEGAHRLKATDRVSRLSPIGTRRMIWRNPGSQVWFGCLTLWSSFCFSIDLRFVVYKCSTSSIRYLVRLRVPLFPGGPAMPLKSVLLNLLLDPFLSG